MITYSQDTDMKDQLKAYKEFIDINKYLKRYMNEYVLLRKDNSLIAYGNNLGFGDRLVIVNPKRFLDELYMPDADDFIKKNKEFRITKALLYPGENLISVILQNTGTDVDLPINNITQKNIQEMIQKNLIFNDIDNPLKDVIDLDFEELSSDIILALRANKSEEYYIDGSFVQFSKQFLGSLHTTKDSSIIYVAKMPCDMPGKDRWCFKEMIYESKDKKGQGTPDMISYLIVHTIRLN